MNIITKNPRDGDLSGFSWRVRLARGYSNLFSPPSLYAVYAFVLALQSMPFWRGVLHAALFGVFASLLPVLFIVYLLRRGKVRDLHISSTRERQTPYLVGIAGAAVALGLLRVLESPPLLLGFALSDLLALSALAVFNRFWLVSAHMTGVTLIVTFTGFVFGQISALWLSPLIVITFAVRLYLRRHNPAEMIGGALLGSGIAFGLASLGII